MQKKSYTLILACVILGTAAFGLHTSLLTGPRDVSGVSAAATNTGSMVAAAGNILQRTIPEGAREYRSDPYHFSVLYPQDLVVREYSEGGGAATVIFQNPGKGEGFQIFIVPYAEDRVSAERFKRDLPSGVRKDTRDAIIGDVTGAAFFSTDVVLGDTREIWFIRGGYLYEVTAPKPLDLWLQSIMQTWMFL